MTPIPDRDNFLSGYIYSSPTGEQVPLGVDDVIMLRRPNPLDPYRGWGPVQTILADLDSSRASAEWNANFFRNSAQPGGIVQVDRRLDDNEFNEFRDRWAEQHRGVANAHRVAVLENGLTWVDRSFSMTDMQFVELRNVGREIIREAFGFPKPLLGTVDDANRANMESAEEIFAKWLVRTRLRRTRQALNTRLLPMFGPAARGLEFDFDDPVSSDVEKESKQLTAQANAAAALVNVGFDPAGTLSAVGLPEIPFAGRPAAPALPAAPVASWDDAVAGLLGEDIEAAMRWEVVTKDDDNVCGPCAENSGRLYRNRAQAYKDYPGGSGYIHCVGAEYGNDCRCKVVKRRKTRDDE
jgi:hypothetical protein